MINAVSSADQRYCNQYQDILPNIVLVSLLKAMRQVCSMPKRRIGCATIRNSTLLHKGYSGNDTQAGLNDWEHGVRTLMVRLSSSSLRRRCVSDMSAYRMISALPGRLLSTSALTRRSRKGFRIVCSCRTTCSRGTSDRWNQGFGVKLAASEVISRLRQLPSMRSFGAGSVFMPKV